MSQNQKNNGPTTKNWIGGTGKPIETIPPNIVMYLINAIYFNGEWTYPFDPDKTETKPFTRPISAGLPAGRMTCLSGKPGTKPLLRLMK